MRSSASQTSGRRGCPPRTATAPRRWSAPWSATSRSPFASELRHGRPVGVHRSRTATARTGRSGCSRPCCVSEFERWRPMPGERVVIRYKGLSEQGAGGPQPIPPVHADGRPRRAGAAGVPDRRPGARARRRSRRRNSGAARRRRRGRRDEQRGWTMSPLTERLEQGALGLMAQGVPDHLAPAEVEGADPRPLARARDPRHRTRSGSNGATTRTRTSGRSAAPTPSTARG